MLALGEWLPTSTGLSGICPVWLSKPNQIHNALSVVALINAFHCLINIDKCTLAREKFLNRDAVVVQVTGLMITVRPLALHQKWPQLSLALSLAPAVFLWQRLNEMNGFSKGLCHCCIIHLVSQGDLQIRTFRTLICLFLLGIFIRVVILLALWDARRTLSWHCEPLNNFSKKCVYAWCLISFKHIVFWS